MRPRLNLEQLEDRTAPAVFGNPWPDAPHLTLSFVPGPAAAAPPEWQGEVLRAFQTWAAHANVNIGLVADGGQPLGADGAPQGDERFGDVRVAAVPLSPGVLALAAPFNVFTGTRSGDILFDSDLLGADSPYDLFSVALHEAGHVLGLDHSDDPASPLFESYGGARPGLTAEDVARLQALYGPRPADAFDARRPNNTLQTASPLSPSDASGVLVADGDLSGLADVDWYQFRAPGASGLTLRLSVAGISLLSARVRVFDGAGRLLATATADGRLGADLEVRLDGSPSAYYVQVEKASGDVFGIGSYRLEVRPDGAPASGPDGAERLPGGDGQALGDTFATALPLRQLVFRTDPRFDYAYAGALAGGTQFFRLVAPQAGTGAPYVMTVMAWTTRAGGPQPLLSVYDAQGRPVAAEVLVRQDGTFVLQVEGAGSNVPYVVAVRPDGEAAADFFLGVDFSTKAVRLDTIASGQVSEDTPASGVLSVPEGRLFHFVLSADAAVHLDIIDASGNVVQALTTGSVTVFLGPGAYFFRYRIEGGSAAPVVSYTLQGLVLDDPIGPALIDPTLAPPPAAGGTTADYSYLSTWEMSYYTFLVWANTSLGGQSAIPAPPP